MIVITFLVLSIVALKGILFPEEFVFLNVIKLSISVSAISVSSICLIALSKVIVILVSTAIPVLLSEGLNVKDGGEVGAATVKLIFEALIALFEESSTVAPIATYTTCSLEKSLLGFIVIIFLSESIVASKSIFEPLELSSLSVIRVSILEFVSSELSVFLIASSKVIVILVLSAIPVVPSKGLKVRVGASTSAVVKLSVVVSVIPTYELLELSSNAVASILT